MYLNLPSRAVIGRSGRRRRIVQRTRTRQVGHHAVTLLSAVLSTRRRLGRGDHGEKLRFVMILTIHGGEGPGEERGVDKAHALPLKRPRGDRWLA